MYYQSKLNATPIALKSMPCKHTECAALKVTCGLNSFIYATFYRPPLSSFNWLSLFDDSLEYLLSLNMPVVITEDVNFNLLIDSTFADNINAHFNLKQVISEPTRVEK